MKSGETKGIYKKFAIVKIFLFFYAFYKDLLLERFWD